MNAAVFHQAVADGDATRVKFLINLGQQARVNQRNKQGYTSLQQSCKDGRYEVADVLLSHGANIAATDKQGRTALHLASTGGYLDIVKLLIASCADINIKDNDGNLAVDVAKNDEITALLQKTLEEKQAKNPETKKVISEDWSQNVTSLPAGSRNSLVSNSSSDSGVFTEENSSVRSNGDYKLSRPNGYTSTRSTLSDSRVMGVLNESDENLYESSRDRARTVHEIGNTVTEENRYEQARGRSNTFDNHAGTLLERNQYVLGNHIDGRISNKIGKREYELASHLSAGNPHKQNQHESHLTVQTSMKMAHNANPQPKLRRSMSERLPARQRKQLSGRRNLSEELSALNLSRVPQNSYYYEDPIDPRAFRSNNLASIPEPQSPNEDLGYGGEILNDFDDYGRSSERDCYASGSRTLPRNRRKREEFYPDRELAWRDGNREEFVCGAPQTVQNRSNNSNLNRIDFYDDVDLYRREQQRNSRGVRKQTIKICPNSNVEDGYLAAGDWNHAYSNNARVHNFSQRDIPRSRMTPENNRFDSRELEGNLVNNNVTVKRRDSACSDTAIASYRRRMMQISNYGDYIEYNGNHDYYYEKGHTGRGLPSYEETLQRKRPGSDSRPAPRQVSHV